MLVYSAGLRVGEVVKSKPEDIDSSRLSSQNWTKVHIVVNEQVRRNGGF